MNLDSRKSVFAIWKPKSNLFIMKSACIMFKYYSFQSTYNKCADQIAGMDRFVCMFVVCMG